MRGKPLDLDYLCRKIAAIDHRTHVTYTDKTNGKEYTYRRRSMDRGWMDVYRREFEFLWEGLREHLEDNPDDAHAANIVEKLACHGAWVNEKGHVCVNYTNKLYLTKAEQPWLIAWIKELPTCDTCGKLTNTVYGMRPMSPEVCTKCWQESKKEAKQ